MMNTLIVPCCGRNFIANQPRWLLPYPPNDILLGKCLKKLGIEHYNRIIVTILQKDLDICPLINLKKFVSEKVEFCILEQETTGPADTVYETIIRSDIKGSIEIKDIDILFERPIITHRNFVTGIHLFDYDSDLKSVRNKSFITRNEQNSILDIIEKTIKSDIISMGLYGFSNAKDFCDAYLTLKENFLDYERIYVSHVIAYLIGVDNKVFNYVEIANYTAIEQEKDYEKLIKCKGTYFIDIEKLNVVDYIKYIQYMEKKGANIYFLANPNSVQKIEEMIQKYNLLGKIIVLNSKHAQVISSEEKLKEAYLNVY